MCNQQLVVLSKNTLFMILLQFQTILSPDKLCVTEKRHLCKGCNLEIFLMVLLSILFNKLPWWFHALFQILSAFPFPVNGFKFKICQTIAGIRMMHQFHGFSNSILGWFWPFGPTSRRNLSQKQAKPTSYFIPVPGNKDVKVDWKLSFSKKHKKIIKSRK